MALKIIQDARYMKQTSLVTETILKVDSNSDVVPCDDLVIPCHLNYYCLSHQANLWTAGLLHFHHPPNSFFHHPLSERMCLMCFDRYLMSGWFKKFFMWPHCLITAWSLVYCQGRLPGGVFNSKRLSGLLFRCLYSLFFRSWKKSACFLIWGGVAWRKKKSFCLYALPSQLIYSPPSLFFPIKGFILTQPRCRVVA